MTGRRRIRAKLTNPKSVASFKSWLAASGARIEAPTNPYEVVRFRGSSGVSVIYSNNRGRPHKMTGEAEQAWAAFRLGSALNLAKPVAPVVVEPVSDAALIAQARRSPMTIAVLCALDASPMRAAVRRLFDLEQAGRLVRSGGGPGAAFRWSSP